MPKQQYTPKTQSVFALVRKKRLSDSDRARVLMSTNNTNSSGMNVLHCFLAYAPFDEQLYDDMLASGHTLNSFTVGIEYSPFQSVLSCRPQDTYAKCEWLLKHDCPLVKSNSTHDLMRFMVERAMPYAYVRRSHRDTDALDDGFVALMHQLLAKGLIGTDLRPFAILDYRIKLEVLRCFGDVFTL